jgi:hypothetical protein
MIISIKYQTKIKNKYRSHALITTENAGERSSVRYTRALYINKSIRRNYNTLFSYCQYINKIFTAKIAIFFLPEAKNSNKKREQRARKTLPRATASKNVKLAKTRQKASPNPTQAPPVLSFIPKRPKQTRNFCK